LPPSSQRTSGAAEAAHPTVYGLAVIVHEVGVWILLVAASVAGVAFSYRHNARRVSARSAWFWTDAILTGLGLGLAAWAAVLALAALFARV